MTRGEAGEERQDPEEIVQGVYKGSPKIHL